MTTVLAAAMVAANLNARVSAVLEAIERWTTSALGVYLIGADGVIISRLDIGCEMTKPPNARQIAPGRPRRRAMGRRAEDRGVQD